VVNTPNAFIQVESNLGLLGLHEASGIETLVTQFNTGFVFGPPIALPPEGHPVRFSWTPVDGATRAEVTSAALRISPVTTQRSLGALVASASGSHYEVSTGSKRIYSLKLNDLKFTPPGEDDPLTIRSASDLPSGFRLVVTLPNPSGGWLPPAHSVPVVGSQGMVPQTLTGASFENRVLRLPDVVASRIRLTIAEGSTPGEFAPHSFTLGSVEGTETVTVRDLEVVGPNGDVAGAFPGELPQGVPFDLDLRVPLETAFNAALEVGAPPDATFTIRGEGTIALSVTGAHGALVREEAGSRRAVIEGEPVAPDLGPVYAAELPFEMLGDLSVRYEGIRILETVSDPITEAQGDVSGPVVLDVPVRRDFPPQALTGRVVRRVGVTGRAPVATELHAQLVSATSGEALGAPGVLRLEPSTRIDTHWVEIPEHPPLAEPVALTLRVPSGRFLWAALDHPLARVAIDDPDYVGRPVTLGGHALAVPSDEIASHLPGYAFTLAAFAGQQPALVSDLFLTVDIADLVVRYAR
jgi:hypothetical protein